MAAPSPRLLLLGLDGADPAIVDELIAAGRLPTLAGLGRDGLRRRLRSTTPAATSPAWATCLTGVNPGRHGVFDFTTPAGYGVRFGTPRPAVATWLESLAAAGLRTGAVGFPGRLHGATPPTFHVAGWDTPLQCGAGRRHVHPPGLYDRILAELGPEALAFDVDESSVGDASAREALCARLAAAVRTRVALTRMLAREHPVDLLAVHFQALDTMGHHAWPRGSDTPTIPATLAATYEEIDRAIATLLDDLRPEAVIAVSDHGMGPTADYVVSLNALLAEGKFLRRAAPSLLARAATLARTAGLNVLPASARGLVLGAAGSLLPDRVETLGRRAGIDLVRSKAFSDDLTYAPSVRLNVRGREPTGRVHPADRARTADDVARFLRAAHRSDGGLLFSSVRRREDVYEGPLVHRAPDLLLEIAPDEAGRTPVLCPPHLRPLLGLIWYMPIPVAERPGRKGGILRGSHRPDGILVASRAPDWARADETLDLRDVAPLVCATLGVPEPPHLEKPRQPRSTAARSTPARSPLDDGLSASERRELGRRLRALGYVEDPDG